MRRAIFNIMGMAMIAFGGMYLTASPATAADADVCGQSGVDSCSEMMDCCDGEVCIFDGEENFESGVCM